VYFFLHKIPTFFTRWWSELTWHRQNQEKHIYLTFDDGPIPVVTEWVVDILAQYQAKATFFCVGDNIRKHPEVFYKVIAGGHHVGNHTFNHLKGWKTTNEQYLQNIKECSNVLHLDTSLGSKPLFRPPYGAITPSQIQMIKSDYEIVMWDVLSGDFEKNVSAERCLQMVLKYTESGSVVVFHDSLKTYEKLQKVLPPFLEYFTSRGYKFVTL
jgi:peptidoglycan-N-acetylglucosamine deacetylase